MKLGLCAAVVVLALSSAASAQEDEARALFDEGLAHFQAREYEAAIEAFDRAFALDPQPEYLFAQAQAERLSGDCPSAIVLYRRFLELSPPEKHASAAHEAIDRCERALASRPEDGAPAEPEPPHDADASAAPPSLDLEPVPSQPREPRAPWHHDPVGGALLGAGVIGLAVGGVYFAKSSSDASAARDAADYDSYIDLMDRAESRRTIAWIGLGAGAGLAVAAGLRYWTFEPDSTTVTVTPTGDGAAVHVLGRF